LQELRRKEKEREREEEAKIEEYSKKKEQILEMRRVREEMKFNEKKAVRQRLIDAQAARLAAMKNREDEILNKQIKEAEIKAEEVERIKREKREELMVPKNPFVMLMGYVESD
jgi:hypothetical protein